MSAQARRARDRRRAGAGETCAGAHRRGLIGNVLPDATGATAVKGLRFRDGGNPGARLIVTLLHALEARNLKRGVAALCIGGGEATAIAVERAVR